MSTSDLTGHNYVWIVTQSVIGESRNGVAPTKPQFPIGMLGKLVTRLPLKASEFYANYLFKFLQIETLILVKNSTSNELSYCIRNFKCEEFFQTSLYIDIGKCWSLQTLEDRRLQRSRIQQKVLDRHL